MSTTSEVLASLQKALAHAEQTHAKLEEARLKLAPLEQAVKDADAIVGTLMLEYQSLTMPESAGRGRRGSSGPRKQYSITPESKIAAVIKRQTTRAINAGKTQKEADAIGKAAGKALAVKLGVKP